MFMNNNIVYLDNAATSYPKPYKVYEEIQKCLMNYCANPGRSGHKMSIYAGNAVYEARKTISDFFNINNSLRLCFAKNATEALNIVIKGILKPGDHVITTSMEHNSVLRPLKYVEKDLGVEVTIVWGNNFGEIDPDSIRQNIKKNTVLIAASLSSNVNGTILPVEEIGKISREHGLLFLLDSAQGAGSVNIDVERMNVDFLAFSGHKGLFGPPGTGGLYVRDGINLCPLLHGGTGSNSKSEEQPGLMPDLFESGTLNLPGVIGLAAGIKFIRNIGQENIEYYKQLLLTRFYESIKDIRGIKIYSLTGNNKNSGILAINFSGYDSSEIASILDAQYGIATRGGFHCAPLAHETLGTGTQGLVRFSMGCFNTIEEVDYTANALKVISGKLFQ
jgi:cysteine desulfurase/selenocysteine lyase